MATLVNELIESGIHFGHRASRWNPKMKPYIHTKRNLIHILDVRETVRNLLRAKVFLQRVVAGGKDVLFVGTKKQIRDVIRQHAEQSQQHYVVERWLGGTLTNFRTIRARLGRLEELERIAEEIQLAHTENRPSPYSKKAESTFNREHERIDKNLGGIRKMSRLPGALVLVDVRREMNAAREARKLGIPTVCLIDTDGDPDLVDIPIPGNDDAMQAVALVIKHLSEACAEGLKGRMAAAPADAAGEQNRGGRPLRRRTGRPTAAERMMGEGGSADAGDKPEIPTAAEAMAAEAPQT